MPEGQVLEFTHVTKRFGDVTALSDFSARIEPGAVTGLLGPNGAGKTTSLRILLGQVRATSGTATIGGVPYFDMRQPLRTVGSVLEETVYRPRRTAARQLQIAAKANGIPVTRVTEVLDLVGLHGDANTRIGTFSLGMRQRLSLATALLGDPGVLVLDEPANGLDPEGIRWMRLLMRRLADEGRTVLVSSHVLSEVEQVADNVVVLSKGQAVYTGGIDVLSDPTTGAVIVDAEDRTPLTAALAAAGLEFDVLRSGVTVRGSDAAAIGALAASAGVALTVLQQRGPSLEEVFLDLVYGRRTEPARLTDAADTDAPGEPGSIDGGEGAADAEGAGAAAAEVAATEASDTEAGSESADIDADGAGLASAGIAAGGVAAGAAAAGAFGAGAVSDADDAGATGAVPAADAFAASIFGGAAAPEAPDADVSSTAAAPATEAIAAGIFGDAAAPEADEIADADDAAPADAATGDVPDDAAVDAIDADAAAESADAAAASDAGSADAVAAAGDIAAAAPVAADALDAEAASATESGSTAAAAQDPDDATDADDESGAAPAAAGASGFGFASGTDDAAEAASATDASDAAPAAAEPDEDAAEAGSTAAAAQDPDDAAPADDESADGAAAGASGFESASETDDVAETAPESTGTDTDVFDDEAPSATDPESDEFGAPAATDDVPAGDDAPTDAAEQTQDTSDETDGDAQDDAGVDSPADAADQAHDAADAGAEPSTDVEDAASEISVDEDAASESSVGDATTTDERAEDPAPTTQDDDTDLIVDAEPEASDRSPISHVPLPFATSAISLPGETIEPTFTELITGLPATGAVDLGAEEEIDDAVDDAVDDVPVEAHEVFAPVLSRDIDDAAEEPAEAGTPSTEEDDDPRLATMRNSLAAARKAYFEDPAPAWPYGKAPDAEPEASDSEAADGSEEDPGQKD